jgi:hypothetical protein
VIEANDIQHMFQCANVLGWPYENQELNADVGGFSESVASAVILCILSNCRLGLTCCLQTPPLMTYFLNCMYISCSILQTGLLRFHLHMKASHTIFMRKGTRYW